MRFLSTVVVIVLMVSGAPAHAQDSLNGTWTTQRSDDGFWIALSVGDNGWRQSRVLRLAQLPEGPVALRLDREPGVIVLEGTRRGDRAAGFFTFTPKLRFNEEMRRLGYPPFDFDALYTLTALDARSDEIRRIKALGYPRLTADELVAMHIHGALSSHIEGMAEVGFDDLSVDDLISTQIHGVTPDFVESMRSLDLETDSIDDLLSMRIHDVTPDYVESIRALGYLDVTIDDLISMRIHDITPEYVRAVNEKLAEQ